MPVIHPDDRINPLVMQLLGLPKGWTDGRRADTVATLVVVTGEIPEGVRAIKGMRRGQYHIDEKLFMDWYRASSPRWKLALVRRHVLPRLGPRAFKEIYSDAWQLAKAGDKHRLAMSLGGFLFCNPTLAHEYEGAILDHLRSRYQGVALAGVRSATQHLEDLSDADLALMAKRLVSRHVATRGTALQGLCTLLERYQDVSERVVTFCLAEKLRTQVERIHRTDSEVEVKRSAAEFLKLAQAVEKVRRERGPRARASRKQPPR